MLFEEKAAEVWWLIFICCPLWKKKEWFIVLFIDCVCLCVCVNTNPSSSMSYKCNYCYIAVSSYNIRRVILFVVLQHNTTSNSIQESTLLLCMLIHTPSLNSTRIQIKPDTFTSPSTIWRCIYIRIVTKLIYSCEANVKVHFTTKPM